MNAQTTELPSVERHEVTPHDRILVIENLIRKIAPAQVIELGAGDFSFQHTAPNAAWIKADMAPPSDILCDFDSRTVSLPLKADSLDLAICTEVLEHLTQPQFLLGEIRRVLRPGGKLLISVPNAVSLTYRIAWMMGHIPSCAACANIPFGTTSYHLSDGNIVGGHVIDFSRSRLEQLVTTLGFRVEQMKGSGLFRNRQLVPHWLVPPSMASNLICVASKR